MDVTTDLKRLPFGSEARYDTGMAKRDNSYEQVYKTIRRIAADSISKFNGDPDGGVIVAAAQAEALVGTLKSSTLAKIKKSYHAKYLHKLFTAMLTDVLEKMPHLTGRIMIVERPRKKERKGRIW